MNDMDYRDLLIELVKLIFLGALIGVGARLAMPGDQRMGIVRTLLYGIAGAIIGGGIALMFDLSDFFVAGAGVLVAALLIGLIHQHGVLLPEDATPDNIEHAPAHQGHDLLDLVTGNDHGDVDREAATEVAEVEEELVEQVVADRLAAQAAPVADVVVVEEPAVLVVEETVVEVVPEDDAVDDAPLAADEPLADEQIEASDARDDEPDNTDRPLL